MADEKQIAGVTFYVENSSCVAGVGGNYVGQVLLSASVNDIDLWQKLLEQLRGMVLYKGSDMKTQIIGTLQSRNSQLEQTIEQTQAQLNEKIQRAEQRASIAEADNEKLEEQVRALNEELSEAMLALAAG